MGESVPHDGAAPADALLEMHRSGALAARYPEAQRLVAELSGRELVRAGNLLARLDADETAKRHPGIPAVTVALTGHGTLPDLLPALTAQVARHGFLLRPFTGRFDGYVLDLGDPGSDLYAAEPDVVLCVLDPAIVFDEVVVPWGPADVERVGLEKTGLLKGLATTFEASCRGTLVLNTLPLLRRYAAQLVDHRSRARLGALWRDLNARLLHLCEEHERVVVLDLDPLAAEASPASDPRMSVYAKAHLSPDLLAAYAREAGHLVRHLSGRTKKCLVLDLDNTLWGGVLGDDGADGIEVGEGHRGEAFREFQRVVKQIGAQGPLLAVVSKNDVEPVRRVLREHPGMVLREDDFVHVIANWRPKPENVAALARELNLGEHSLVFADDSAFERWLVRSEHPDVAVVDLDADPALHGERLLADGWFDVRQTTAEDHVRKVRYQDEWARKDFLHTFDSVEDYLRELDVRVVLADAAGEDAARISQLTMRTNQFNTVTCRLGVAEIRELLKDSRTRILTIRSRDRFGDNGMVGALFTRWSDETVRIDGFLLSCRVFGRGIEQACLAAVLRHARAGAARTVHGAYRPTPKNGGVADLYSRHGFVRDAAPGGGSSGLDGSAEMTWFRHDLAEIFTPPDHVRLIDDFGGHVP
ncbi:HAD-IIIC family phosphatase [Actinomadura napierensis]|uniref:HAD-IIIC family phosphatase n=1 Tax=Actinomadura napierensis TaxID=267854 RepID=A0ABP5LCP8_9ACTN